MDPAPDTSLFQWIISGIVTVCGSIGAFIFNDMYGRLKGVAKAAQDGDRELWLAVNKERDSSQQHREAIIREVGALPTKTDLISMETRIMAAITGRHP
jgi:hypothetical protein